MAAALRNRLGAAVALIALVISTFGVSIASAAVPRGAVTASLATPGSQLVRTVLAGTAEQPFAFTISNALTYGSNQLNTASINTVIINPPPDAGLFTPTQLIGPGAWRGTQSGSGVIVFQGDTLRPGASATFTVNANVGRPAADASRNFSVTVSDDGGKTAQSALAATTGALSASFRVLKVTNLAIVGGPEVTDGSVTGGQTVTLRETVVNAGGSALSVTPQLRGDGFTAATPAAQTIPAGGSGTFDIPVTFAEVTAASVSRTITADASATGADALEFDLANVVVQKAASFTATERSLTPADVVPGNAYAFSLTVTNGGGVATTVDKLASTLRFSTFQAPIDTPSAFTAGQVASVTFVKTLVPLTIADGTYTPLLSIRNTDANGFTRTVPVTIVDTLTLDRLAPVALPTLTPRASAVKDAPPAATNGEVLIFGGEIRDGTPAVVCTTCTVTSARLKQYGNGIDLNKDIPVDLEVSDGQLSGSYTPGGSNPALDATATSLRLAVVAADKSGISSPVGLSDAVPVDLVAPRLDTGFTGGIDNQNTRRIDVMLSERAVFPQGIRASDFSVDRNIVTAVALTDCGARIPTRLDPADCSPNTNDSAVQGNTHPIGNRVTLTLANALGQDERPTVTYQATDVTKGHDRVRLRVLNLGVQPADGILPPLPVIDTVSGMGLQEGSFYTNASAPVFRVSSISAGHTISIWRDVNGDGRVQRSGATPDELLAEKVAQNVPESITSNELGTTDRSIPLLIDATDAGSNTGPARAYTLVLDFTRPTVAATVAAGRELTLNFNEVLARGRDFTQDWRLDGTRAGVPETFGLESVTGSGNTRTIKVTEDSYDPTVLFTRVTYSLLAADNQRYEDRAGNPLLDFTRSL